MELKIGDHFKKEFIITDKMIKDFSLVTGDLNPVHINEEFAKNSVFQKRIAHGMLIGSLISSVLGNDFPGIGTIYISQTMKFIIPVFIDDCISIHIEIIEIKRNNWIKLKTDCYNQDIKMVINGEAIVIPPAKNHQNII